MLIEKHDQRHNGWWTIGGFEESPVNENRVEAQVRTRAFGKKKRPHIEGKSERGLEKPPFSSQQGGEEKTVRWAKRWNRRKYNRHEGGPKFKRG